MAIDTRQKRQAAAGVPFPWAPPVLPNTIDNGFQRAQAAGGYYFTAQTIRLNAFTNTRVFGSPTIIQATAVTGTARKFSIFIDGVDRSEWVRTEPSPQITAEVNSKFTGNFRTIDISGAAWTPTEGDPVKIYEGTTLLFNGWITRTVEERLMGTVSRVYVTCGDAGVKLGQRVVNAFYGQILYGSAYYIVPDLIAKHAADLGITYVRSPGPDFIDLTPLGDVLFYAATFTEAMNQLAKRFNADWVVDLNNNLYFVTLAGATVNSNAFTDSSGNWLEIQATRTISLEGNRIFAKSSAQLLQTQTDAFPGDPFGLYSMTYPPRDSSLLPLATINGNPAVVVSQEDAGAGAVYDFYRIGSIIRYNLTATPLTSSDTVTITYPSPVPYVAVAEDLTDISTNGLKEVILECGNITSKTELDAIAAAWLLRLKERATQLNVRTGGVVGSTVLATSQRDWQPGQLVSVNLSASSGTVPVVDDFLVDSYQSQIIQNTVRMQSLVLSNAQYQRTANPQKFLQDLIARLRTVALPQTQVMTLTGTTNLGIGFVLNVDQQINLDSTNGPFTVTLPAANEMYGKELTFKKISSDSNPITVAAPGVGQVIDDSATQTISDPFQPLVIAGNQWQ